jgi:hypothetical protein
MARRKLDDDDDDLPLECVATANRWETPEIAQEVQTVLDAVEAPPIDDQVRLELQKIFYRRNMFGTDGREHLILLLRTVLESEGNQDALIKPIVSAVSSCMREEWTDRGLEWIEAFDGLKLTALLATMRSISLFSEKNLGYYLGLALRNKLAAILDPPQPEPVKKRGIRKGGRPKRAMAA